MTLKQYLAHIKAERKKHAALIASRLTVPELEKVHGELVDQWNKWRDSDVLPYITAIRTEHKKRKAKK